MANPAQVISSQVSETESLHDSQVKSSQLAIMHHAHQHQQVEFPLEKWVRCDDRKPLDVIRAG